MFRVAVVEALYQSREKFLSFSFRFSFRNTNFSKFLVLVFKFLPSRMFEAVEKSLHLILSSKVKFFLLSLLVR